MSSNLTESTVVSLTNQKNYQIGDSVLLNRQKEDLELIDGSDCFSNRIKHERRLTYPENSFGNPELNAIIYGEKDDCDKYNKNKRRSIWKRIINSLLCRG